MEKRFLTAVLVTTFLLNGCVTDNGNYSSFKDVTGVTISDINEFKISENVTTSSAWQYQYDDYTFLNTKYVKVNFNIKNELLDKPLSDGEGAICLHFMTDVLGMRTKSWTELKAQAIMEARQLCTTSRRLRKRSTCSTGTTGSSRKPRGKPG